MTDPHLLDALVAAAIDAGGVIQRFYEGGCAVMTKSDASPVTEADHAAEAIILRALAAIAPGVPVVAEEECAAGRVPQVAERFFLVDPLDGTKEFVARRGNFTVNIALIEHGRPVMGVVYAPARARLYAGSAAGAWASDQPPHATRAPGAPIRVRPAPPRITVVGSASHGSAACDAYLDRLPVGARTAIGSSLKFCLLAEGAADLYARSTPTMEWDTAAGHAVLAAAGGHVAALDGTPLGYGKPNFFNPGFVATGDFNAPAFR